LHAVNVELVVSGVAAVEEHRSYEDPDALEVDGVDPIEVSIACAEAEAVFRRILVL